MPTRRRPTAGTGGGPLDPGLDGLVPHSPASLRSAAFNITADVGDESVDDYERLLG